MRLQCDPTVIYGMERFGKYNGTLTGKDLSFDSLYNTYEHGGLPPPQLEIRVKHRCMQRCSQRG